MIFSLLCLLAPASAADKPNVIVIMADDQGSVDLGSYTPETRPLAQGFDHSFGHNLAERHPDQVRHLRERHEKHLD